MKEFSLPIKDIFNGITSTRMDSKKSITLSECHNLEPIDEDYDLHKLIIDMDEDDYAWGNP